MTDPKRRDPAALRAHQRQRQAGGPHDTEPTRGEEERMAIDESLRADLREGLLRDELERSEAERDRLAAENAELRATLARVHAEAWDLVLSPEISLVHGVELRSALIDAATDHPYLRRAALDSDAAPDSIAALLAEHGSER